MIPSMVNPMDLHTHTPNYEAMRRRLDEANIRPGMCEEELQTIKGAAREFEAYFIQILLREMRNTIPDDGGLIPTSQAERIFTEMLDEEIAKEAARAGGIGLAEVIVQQLTRDAYTANMR